MRFLFLILGFCAVFSLNACKTTSETPPPEEEAAVENQIVDGIEGTVTYMDLEGGFYGIVGDDGGKYFPINLDESFREDGLRVRFTVRERNDVMTTTMWGTTVEITAMERL